MKKNKDKKRVHKRKGLKITAIVLGSLVALFGILALVNVIGNAANLAKAKSFEGIVMENQLAPTEEDGYWTFTTDRELKVLQLTDIHLGGGFMSLKKDGWVLNAIAAMITYEKPDLVIATGDIVYPVPIQAGTFNNLESMKLFVGLMETLGVYWTLSFGNHDSEVYSYYNRTDVAKFFESGNFDYCLFKRGPSDIKGEGNQIINVKNSLGIITQSLVILDSHSYVDGDYLGIKWKYDNIHENQIDWYKTEITKLNAHNARVFQSLEDPESLETDYSTVKSLMFFHIPIMEYRDAWMEYVDNDFEDTESVTHIYGAANEGGRVVYAGVAEDNLFETILELGSTQGIFCGHDHLNNFSLDYKGVRLTYGMSLDYLAYMGIHRKGAQRGCTVITLNTDGTFECVAENYYQEKYVAKYKKESVSLD